MKYLIIYPMIYLELLMYLFGIIQNSRMLLLIIVENITILLIFSLFSSLVILFSAVLPSNFRCHKCYVRSCLLNIYSKQTWISDTEYDPLGNFSFYVEAEILYLLFLYSCFMFFSCIVYADI